VSKHKVPPLSGRIVQEATTWFVEINEGEASQPEREAFVEWLKTSPEHIRAYLQVSAHWEEAGALSEAALPSITDLVALARESTTADIIPIGEFRPGDAIEFATSVGRSADKLSAPPVRTHRSQRYLLAASLASAIIGASALLWFEHERGLYTTDIAEQRTVRLGDGSTVELNAHSKLRVTLGKHERDVELIAGQALFRVAKDPSRPFIVHSGETDVLAVGTQFDVNKHRSGTTVTVVEGRVAVFAAMQSSTGGGPESTSRAPGEARSSRSVTSARATPTLRDGAPESGAAVLEHAPKSEIFLAAGEQLTVSSAAVKMAPNADVAAATAWTQKQIVFNSTPLSDVVDEFNRYNTRQFAITDPKIANTKISGQFSSTNPDSLLRGLDALNEFNIRETPGRIEISAK
jgi:transmembrane sensor